MNFLSNVLVLASFITGIISAQEAEEIQPMKIATVDIQELVLTHHKAQSLSEELNLSRSQISKENRYAKSEAQQYDIRLEEMAVQIKSGKLTVEETESLRNEAKKLLKERKLVNEGIQTQTKKLNQSLNNQVASRMKAILEEVVLKVAEVGEQQGYDLVYDISGKNSSQFAPIMFLKSSVDITSQMKEELAK